MTIARKLRIKKLLIGTLIGVGAVPAAVQAQDGPPKWTVGAIGMGYLSPFEAERYNADGDTKVNYMGAPYVAYRGERFFIEGTQLGFHVIKPSNADTQFTFDVVGSARMLPGSSRDTVSGDLGLSLGVSGKAGFLKVTGLRDVFSKSDGYEVTATIGHNFEWEKFSLTPSISAIWQDKKMANYMWGVTQKQHDNMIKDDKPILPVYELTDSVVNYSASLFANYRFADSWSLIAFASATKLDKKVRENPGITKDYDATVGLGIAYSF